MTYPLKQPPCHPRPICTIKAREKLSGCDPSGLRAVPQAVQARSFRAVHAAEELIFALDAVADDPAAAMGANGSERVNGAFERVESVRLAVDLDRKGLVVIISADFANLLHCRSPFIRAAVGSMETVTRGTARGWCARQVRKKDARGPAGAAGAGRGGYCPSPGTVR